MEQEKRWEPLIERFGDRGDKVFDRFYEEVKKFTFKDKDFVWNYFLCRYGFEGVRTVGTFPLINTDDLTELVKQLNEDSLQDVEFMKKFGIEKRTLSYLKTKTDQIYIILDNLANQIIARCVIVANRLTHGIDKESEENIMSFAFGFMKCFQIPKPKIFLELKNYGETAQWLENLAKRVLNDRDPELLSKIQDLPYLNPKCKLE